MKVRTLTDTSSGARRGSLLGLLFGRPLTSDEGGHERIGPLAAVPIFGLDALGSAAYGPEAALTVLIPLGLTGITLALPITIGIIILLGIVYFSYRQTIEAYPAGAGSYTVARDNLGPRLALFTGASLTVDYLLNVAVGISSGVGAMVSAAPSLQPHTLGLCLGFLLLITIVNLRGVRESGLVFMAPTYVFVGCLMIAIAIGVWKSLTNGGHPTPVVAPPQLPAGTVAISGWLLMRAFSSGCAAMTGVEAVSNGVQAFREPVAKNAKRTLTIIIAILAAMLAGIAYLARAYKIRATEPGQPGYRSVLSQLLAAVMGTGWFYYLAIGSILAVLALSANTSFAAFPRLCSAMAQHGYLPYGFRVRGRRLVYSYGVYALAVLAALLLIAFGGVTDRLIPLFAIGAFLSFTMSQMGMVVHWQREGGQRARRNMIINAAGALATGLTTIVIAIAKFTEGAWLTIVFIPLLISLMTAIRRHYRRVAKEVATHEGLTLQGVKPPLVVVPIEEWNKVAQKALRFAMTLSDHVQALHINSEDGTGKLQSQWEELVEAPARQQGLNPPELVVINSPYRNVVGPIYNYLLKLEDLHPGRFVTVVLSELVERRWYHFLLHNQRGQVLTALLMLNGDRRITVLNVPWYLRA